MRLAPFFALLSILIAGYMPTACRTQNPLVPPGPVQPIVPPAPVVVPTPAPPLVPIPDDGLGLEIIAKVNGVPATEPVVSAPPRSLVVLTLTGGAMTETTAVTWSLNAPTVSLDLTQEGRHVAYSPFGDAPMLFTASINGETSPYVAQRWIVAGGNPGPAPPDPGPQPPTVGQRELILFYESGDNTPAFSRLILDLRDGTAAKYFAERKHTLTILDDDTPDPNGQRAKVIEKWQAEITGTPILLVVDKATGALVGKKVLGDDATGVTVVDIVKQFGG